MKKALRICLVVMMLISLFVPSTIVSAASNSSSGGWQTVASESCTVNGTKYQVNILQKTRTEKSWRTLWQKKNFISQIKFEAIQTVKGKTTTTTYMSKEYTTYASSRTSLERMCKYIEKLRAIECNKMKSYVVTLRM